MNHNSQRLRNILEAALFAAEEPLSVARLQRLFNEEEAPGHSAIEAVLAELTAAYGNRGVRLVETAGGYQFQTDPDTNPWIQRLFQTRAPRFSRAVLETLAIIAYRQPATRSEIEDIRGVSLSSGVLRTLTDREWVRVVGRKDVPGRPSLYGTTDRFLSYFGLHSLEDLPPLRELQEADTEVLAEHLAQASAGAGEEQEDGGPPPEDG